MIDFSHPEFFYPLGLWGEERDTQGGSWNDDHHHLTGSENGTRVAIEKEGPVPVPVPVPSGVDCRGVSRRQDLKGTSWASPRPGCGPSSSSCQRIIGCQPAVRIRDLVLGCIAASSFFFFPPFLCCISFLFFPIPSILLFYFSQYYLLSFFRFERSVFLSFFPSPSLFPSFLISTSLFFLIFIPLYHSHFPPDLYIYIL